MSDYESAIVTPSHTYYFPFDPSHQWDVSAGYASPRRKWIIPADTAAAIFADLVGLTGSAAECILHFGDLPGGTVCTVLRVIPLYIEPTDNFQRVALVMVDVRWYVEQAVLACDVNVRRRVGDLRLVGDTPTSWTPVDTVAYAPWSLNSGAAFDWHTFASQVLTYLCTARHGRPAITFVFDSFSVINPTGQLVQETTTDGDGPAGLKRAIESIPGAGVYVDLIGVIHVYERTQGAEIPTITGLPPELYEHGDCSLVSEYRRRPLSHYRVYFDYEIEVRLTYDIGATVTDDSPYLIPVLQVTDLSLLIPAGTYYGVGAVAARTVGQGTWISQDEAYAAWAYDVAHGGPPISPGAVTPLTDAVVANHWYDDGLVGYGTGPDGKTDQPVWDARIAELKRCYRTFFRVNPGFWDKVRHAWTVRAAIIDPTTGQRAPSPVYSNYSLTIATTLPNAGYSSCTKNVSDSYPVSGLIAAGNPSGFRLHLEDEELGIFDVSRDLTRFAGFTKIAPSDVTTRAQVADGVVPLEVAEQQLTPNTTWKLATVISLAPGSPNDLRRFYEVQVTPTFAASNIGLSTALVLGQAPDIELRCQMSDARIAWRDADSATILSIFGTLPSSGITTNDPITSLVPINLTQELQPAAYSLVAADLLCKLDHYEGVQRVAFNNALVPIGSIDSVVHRVDEDLFVSEVHCNPIPPPFRATDFLQGSARSFLLKEIAQAGH